MRGIAAELLGTSFPDSVTVEGKNLSLNGLGIREATIFKVKAYVAALYVEAKSKNADEILKAPGPKKVDLHFVRDVGEGKIRDAWMDAFKKNCQPNCDALRPEFDKLVASMTSTSAGRSNPSACSSGDARS